MSPEKITIGKIVNTHGCRGWLRVLPLTDFPERFRQMDRVLVVLNNTVREYVIEQVRPYKHFILIKFQTVSDLNAAAALKGALLQVDRQRLVKLPAGAYYIFDLIGMKVYTVEQEYLGEIKDVLQTGANDVYVVEGGQDRPLLIPALKQVVREIDLEKRQMRVALPTGLR